MFASHTIKSPISWALSMIVGFPILDIKFGFDPGYEHHILDFTIQDVRPPYPGFDEDMDEDMAMMQDMDAHFLEYDPFLDMYIQDMQLFFLRSSLQITHVIYMSITHWENANIPPEEAYHVMGIRLTSNIYVSHLHNKRS